MLRYLFPIVSATLALTLILAGCQSGPTEPDPLSAPGDAIARVASGGQPHRCLGYYLVSLNKETFDVNVVPVRSAEWHFNMTGVLNQTMGISAKGVPAQSDPANGLFVIDVTLEHPFATKPQFSGFDVKGIVMTPGTLNAGGQMFADADEVRLENADGYTRWWNPTEFTQPGVLGYIEGTLAVAPPDILTATVNPYRIFADSLDATSGYKTLLEIPPDSDNGRAVFRAGSSNTRRYRLRFPMDPWPQVIYGYAIDTAWDYPDPNPPMETPDDFPISANQPEPFYVATSVVMNTLYFDEEAVGGGVGGGMLELEIGVSDWQGLQYGNIADEVSSVYVFAPDLFSGGFDAQFTEEVAQQAKWRIDLTGSAVPAHSGEMLVVIRVGSSDGSTYKQAMPPAPEEPLATYRVITLDIPNPDCEADTNNSFGEAVGLELGELVADQVCVPFDEADYYTFEIPLGNLAAGTIDLLCEAASTTVGIYDSEETLITESGVSGGTAQIGLDSLQLGLGSYYIRVATTNSDQVAPYCLTLNATLNSISPAEPIEVTPSDLVVKPTRLWLEGDIAYLTGDIGVWVYSLTTPTDPVQLAYEPYSVPEDAAFSYPYLYYAERLGPSDAQLNVIDFNAPTAPVLHEDVVHFSDTVSNLCMDDSTLYVALRTSPSASALYVYDYGSDPLNPTQLGSSPIPHVVEKMALLKKDAFDTHIVLSTISTLNSYNVQEPTSITSAGTYILSDGYVKDMCCLGGDKGDYMAVVIDADFAEDGHLYIFRQTLDPLLIKVSDVDLPGAGGSVDVQGDYAYIGDGPAGMSIVDIANPGLPAFDNSIGLISKGHDVSVDGNTAIVIPQDAGMQVINITDPTTPSLYSRLYVVNTPQAIESTGDYLFVAVGDGTDVTEPPGTHYAVTTVDISTPGTASVVEEFLLEYPPVNLYLEGSRLAVAEEERFTLLDVTDPLDIQLLGALEPGINLISVATYQNALYVGTAFNHVYVYDITDPSSPVAGPILDFSDICRDFTFHAGHVYMSIGSALEIYSITDPLDPQYVDTFSVLEPMRESMAIGDVLYFVSKTRMQIADVSTPESPVRTGAVEIDPTADLSRISIEGLFGYVQGATTVPHTCTVWPVDNPVYFGQIYDHDPYGCARDLLVLDGYLYEGSNDAGLRIHDLY